MYTTKEELHKKAEWNGKGYLSRHKLMDRLQCKLISMNSSWTALATFLKILLSQWSEIINFSFMVKLMYVVSGCRAPPRIFFFFYLQCWLSSSFSRLQFYVSLFDFCDFRNLIEKVTYACGLFLDLPFSNIVNYSITTKYVITDSTMKKNRMFLMHYTYTNF